MNFKLKKPDFSSPDRFKAANTSYKIKGSLDRFGDWMAGHRDWVLVGSIFLLAAAFRLWRSDTLPVALHPDEALHGLDAKGILGGDIVPYFEASGDALLSFLQIIPLVLLGDTAFALRSISIVAGITAVIMTYLAARRWFSYRVGVIAALLMATSSWAVQLSRLGITAALTMLIIPLLLWTIHKALETDKAGWYVASGVLIGGSIYANGLFIISIVVALLLLIYAFFYYKEQLLALKQPLTIIGLSALLALLPLGLFMILEPTTYFERVTSSTIVTEPLESLQLIPSALIATLTMLHIKGDSNFLYNLGGLPQLNALAGILLVLGIMLALRRFQDIRYSALLVLTGVFLVPSVLMLDDAPNAAAAAGAIAPIFILCGIGMSELYMRWKGVFPRNPVAHHTAMIAIILVVSSAGVYDAQRYFIAWANAPESYQVHREELQATAEYIEANPIDGKYIILLDEVNDRAPIRFLVGNGPTTYIDTEEASSFELQEGDVLLVPQTGSETPAPESTEALTRKSVISPHRSGVVLLDVYESDS